jgi:hypothetical protein
MGRVEAQKPLARLLRAARGLFTNYVSNRPGSVPAGTIQRHLAAFQRASRAFTRSLSGMVPIHPPFRSKEIADWNSVRFVRWLFLRNSSSSGEADACYLRERYDNPGATRDSTQEPQPSPSLTKLSRLCKLIANRRGF